MHEASTESMLWLLAPLTSRFLRYVKRANHDLRTRHTQWQTIWSRAEPATASHLKGMWAWPPSDSFPMTVPSVSRLRLMNAPSARCPFVTVTCRGSAQHCLAYPCPSGGSLAKPDGLEGHESSRRGQRMRSRCWHLCPLIVTHHVSCGSSALLLSSLGIWLPDTCRPGSKPEPQQTLSGAPV